MEEGLVLLCKEVGEGWVGVMEEASLLPRGSYYWGEFYL